MSNKPGRNDLCPCGSGKKYKKCCLVKQSLVVGDRMIYQRLRETEGRVMAKIDDFFAEQFDQDDYLDAWFEFLLWPEEDLLDPTKYEEADYMFPVWRQFHWLSDEEPDDLLSSKPPKDKIALLYLAKKSGNPLEKEFIHAAVNAPWCFYQIMSVVAGQSMVLKNLLSDEVIEVTERQASQNESVGSMLFTTVVQLHGKAMMLGGAPYLFQASHIMQLLDFKEAVSAESGIWNNGLIFEYDTELFDFYWAFKSEIFNPVMPELHNTDGDRIEIHRLVYQLHCEPEVALEALKSLAIGWNDEDFQREKSFDEAGQLVHIHFPWLKNGNKQSKEWELTVLGHLTLKDNRLEVEVNSRERVTSIKRRISQRLKKDQIQFLVDEIQDMQQLMENFEPSTNIPEATAPELASIQDDFEKKHWQQWVDMPIPALGDMTPRESVKSSYGRHRVESLLTSFSFNNPEHKKWVYQELGLEL